MSRHQDPEDLTPSDLRQLLSAQRRAAAQERLGRLHAAGRVVDVPGAPAPDAAQWTAYVEDTVAHYGQRAARRRWFNRALLLVELAAVIGLIIVAARLWQTNRQLNADLAVVQRAQVEQIEQLQRQAQQTATAAAQATAVTAADLSGTPQPAALPAGYPPPALTATPLPTPTAATMSGVAVLPGGHEPPLPGQVPQPGEAGDIPEEILAAAAAYEPPPAPTPGPELALRIRIPAIGVDHPVVQGDDWEQLKLGVGQHIGSAQPGQAGNIVLSAHNDIYGEIFRNLDRLAVGNEVILSTATRDYTYVIEDLRIVAPTDVWVMAPTAHAQATLISCYPYRINTHRIVVFARLLAPAT